MKKIASILCLVLAFGASALSAAEFKEGVQYLPIDPAPARSAGEEVEVVEFFMYGCPHCNDLEPYVQGWLAKKPANVKFVRVPALFRGPAQLHARAFYALDLIGEGERIHPQLFHAIHQDRKRLNSLQELEDFLVSQGVDGIRFRDAMNAPQVQAQLVQALELLKKYDIKGVPTMIVDGRYRTNSRGMKNYQDFIEVVDFLVERVRADRRKPAEKE